MLIIGLTGGIGMGKSAAASMLRKFGFPVHDADAVVHALLAPGGGAVKKISKRFPEAVRRKPNGQEEISRKALGKAVFGNLEKLGIVEGILHPLVRKAEREFIQAARRDKAKAVVLEIPLLFETGADHRCDVVLCVFAPLAVRRARVMKRPGMTKERFSAILARQMPEGEKKRLADYLVPSGEGFPEMRKKLKEILLKLGVWEG